MSRNAPATGRSHEGGFSLIEALAAGVLVLVVMVGVLPLFTRSAIDNVSGKESTIATTHGKWTLEEINQLPLDRQQLILNVGETRAEDCAAWNSTTKEWDPYACTNARPAGTNWGRASNLRQFSVGEVLGETGSLENPLAGGTPDRFVHIREIGVVVEGERSGPLGPRRTIDLLTLRGF